MAPNPDFGGRRHGTSSFTGTPVFNTVAEVATITAGSAASTPSSESSGDSGGNGSGADSSRGANYFFGFLITFVLLLLIFAGCGLGSRRRMFFSRRFQNADAFGPWTTYGDDGIGRGEIVEPVVYEKAFEKAEETGDKWADLKPLSATLIRRPRDPSDATSLQKPSLPEDPPPNPADSDPTSTSSTPAEIHRRLPAWLPGRKKKPPSEPPTAGPEDIPETIQVAFLIVMPSMASSSMHAPKMPTDEEKAAAVREREREFEMPEYQIGMATVPWKTEIRSRTTSSPLSSSSSS
ncbi:hypothetical protein NLJ89_g3189 [Agrocybe chaxingu]|uniref:Uncharacterized protein n=1 Tax=Agrocybe chaxingu TaxID=84603 RepID=A0A9W8K4G9_9AGAR|nr:hypothetical protein NLJ89_g3189 [Agrocybe chaxingu]